MHCVETVAAKSDNLCDLLARNKITIRIVEVNSDRGEWIWQTQTEPCLMTWDPGCWGGGAGWVPCYGYGDTVEAAAESLCENISGQIVKIKASGWFSASKRIDLTLVKVSL